MSLFTRLPITVNDPSLPLIPAADMVPLADYELGSYDHWVFGESQACLVGLNNHRALTLQGAAPTYNSASAVIGRYGNALITDRRDSAAQTFCAVVKLATPPSSGDTGKIIMGAGAPSSGAGAYNAGSFYGHLYSASDANGQLSSQAYGEASCNAVVSPIDTGTHPWVFLASSEDYASGSMKTISFVGGAGSTSTPQSVAKTLSDKLIAVGNAWQPTAVFGQGMEIAEAVIFDGALDLAGLAAAYARSKARMARRGVTVI